MKSASIRFLILSLLFVGAGCRSNALPSVDLPSTPPVESPVAAADDQPQPFYVAYSADELSKAKLAGRPILLYFWAGWCPICRAEEPGIKSTVEGSGLPVAGFRVDFDTQDDLKKQFRIPYQHTTVILDSEGQESARFTGPTSSEELLAALAAAAGN